MKRKVTEAKILLLTLIILVAAVLFTLHSRTLVRAEDYDTKLLAATIMQDCMDCIAEYKKEKIPANLADIHNTGMLGDSFTGITTTLGVLEAKRTTANSDMAALVVQLLKEAGVRRGDTIGAGFSGSFPALNIAVLSACAAMDVEVIYISSVGSSAFGANQEDLTFPDMAYKLVQDGLLPKHSAAITWGGDDDCGFNMEPKTMEKIEGRLLEYGIPLWKYEDYSANITARMNLYESLGPISCFVGVGGNITTSGKNQIELGQGVISQNHVPINEKSGLLERYVAEGTAVIYLLNIKKLTAEYGLPYDPLTLPRKGTSSVYFSMTYSKLPAFIGLTISLILLVYNRIRRKEDV